MNHFYAVTNRPSILANHPAAGYLDSEEFRERSQFDGATAMEDSVRATLYMLKQCALRPTYAETALKRAHKTWVIHLDFFGVSNPVGRFALPPGRDLTALTLGIQENMGSRMYRAAQRVMHWRGMEHRRAKFEVGVRRKMVATQGWPSPEDFRTNETAARARQTALGQALNEYMHGVRDRRNERLARLSGYACPGVKDWTTLLADIAQHTFMDPPGEIDVEATAGLEAVTATPFGRPRG